MNHIHLLFSKPFFGIITGMGATILTWIGILTPIIGFISVCVGLAAAIYSLIHKRNQVLKDHKKSNVD